MKCHLCGNESVENKHCVLTCKVCGFSYGCTDPDFNEIDKEKANDRSESTGQDNR